MTNFYRKSLFSSLFLPFCILGLLVGIFLTVWLRSGVKTVEYNIALLDNQKTEILRERKAVLAEKANFLSIENLKDKKNGKISFVFPDRTKVIYVKKDEKVVPYRASFEEGREQIQH
jgi:hypothetical protein